MQILISILHGFGFDIRETFSLSGSYEFCKNGILYGVDNSSSVHANNRKKDNLILCKGPTEGLDDTIVTAETEYSINFIEQQQQKIKFQKNII